MRQILWIVKQFDIFVSLSLITCPCHTCIVAMSSIHIILNIQPCHFFMISCTPARGHIANSMALKNRAIWLKLPHFHVNNIFLRFTRHSCLKQNGELNQIIIILTILLIFRNINNVQCYGQSDLCEVKKYEENVEETAEKFWVEIDLEQF